MRFIFTLLALFLAISSQAQGYLRTGSFATSSQAIPTQTFCLDSAVDGIDLSTYGPVTISLDASINNSAVASPTFNILQVQPVPEPSNSVLLMTGTIVIVIFSSIGRRYKLFSF
jgi:hypothetical protein